MADFQIKNTNVDSNNWINLRLTSFNLALQKTNYANPLNGYSLAKLPEGKKVQIQPIAWVLGFVIDVDDFASNTELWSLTPSTLTGTCQDGSSKTSLMNLGALYSLWSDLTGATFIKASFGDPTTANNKSWQNYQMSSVATGYGGDAYSICIVIDNISIQPEDDSDGRHMLRVSMTCREVSPDGTFT
jgi:hypothetical protein